MSVFELTGGVLFILAFVYFFMGLLAFTHVKNDFKPQHGHPISMLWPFNESVYDSVGKKLCKPGRLLFGFVWGGGALWFFVKYIIFS